MAELIFDNNISQTNHFFTGVKTAQDFSQKLTKFGEKLIFSRGQLIILFPQKIHFYPYGLNLRAENPNIDGNCKISRAKTKK